MAVISLFAVLLIVGALFFGILWDRSRRDNDE